MYGKLALAALLSSTYVLADFQIYSVKDDYPDDVGGFGNNAGWRFFTTEPDCDTVNNGYMVQEVDYATDYGVNADVTTTDDIHTYDYTRFEWNTDMGHFTIYGMSLC